MTSLPPGKTFEEEVAANIRGLGSDEELQRKSSDWVDHIARHKYAHNFRWMGRPIIQLPQDMIAMQEIIWALKPKVIVETGIAHGGSLVFYASMLELNAIGGGPQDALVVGVDIDIRKHNRVAIEAHPMMKRIRMVEGSSIDPKVIAEVAALVGGRAPVVVCLDSHHTHDHVLAELRGYAPLTSVGSYCVVFDTVIEAMAADAFPDRPWSIGNNPHTAVQAYLSENDAFEIDRAMNHKLLVSVAPGGYLKRVR